MPDANDAASASATLVRSRVEAHQPRACRGRAEHAERRGRMPALGVVVEVDRERELGLHLEAGDVRDDEVAAAAAELVGQREQRGEHRRRRMAAERVVAVVEVEHVRRGAVHQRGIERADAARAAEQQRGTRREVERARDELRRRLAAAGQRDADGVEDADLRPLQRAPAVRRPSRTRRRAAPNAAREPARLGAATRRHAGRAGQDSVLDAGLVDQVAPLLDLRLDVRREFGRCAADRLGAVGRHLLGHLGQVHDAHDLAVELVDDGRRRAGRREHAVPAGDLVAGHAGLLHRRQLRHRRRAARGGDGQRTQLARFDERARLQARGEQHVDLAADHVGHRRLAAAIRHVRHLDAGERAEQRARQMAGAADTRRAVRELARLRLRERDQFAARCSPSLSGLTTSTYGCVVTWLIGREVLQQVVRMLAALQRDVHRMTGGDHRQPVAVGRRLARRRSRRSCRCRRRGSRRRPAA